MAFPLMVEGNMLEGGGQILRNSLTLSVVLNRPFEIFNIRAARKVPGLRPQHLSCVELAERISSATPSKCRVGTTGLLFSPNCIAPGEYHCDIKTAGSVTLVLQCVLPCLAFAGAKSSLSVRGGTNVPFAPSIDYLTAVTSRALRLFGAEFDVLRVGRGVLPRGGGEVVVNVKPLSSVRPVDLTVIGTVASVDIKCCVLGATPHGLLKKTANTAKRRLQRAFPGAIYNSEWEDSDLNGPSFVLVVVETSTGCVLGAECPVERGTDCVSAGEDLGARMLAYLEAGICADEYLQDQIILWMALAAGQSRVVVGEVTLHTRSSIAVAEQFSNVKFTVEACGDGKNMVTCSPLQP